MCVYDTSICRKCILSMGSFEFRKTFCNSEVFHSKDPIHKWIEGIQGVGSAVSGWMWPLCPLVILRVS